jgi:hypothetical protein
MVTSLTVTFDRVVSFVGQLAQAFTLTRISDGAAVTFTASQTLINNGTQTQVTLTGFTGAATSNASLADGRYTLTVLASQVKDTTGNFFMADNFVFADNGSIAGDQLFRLLGDSDGNRVVDALDLLRLRTSFGKVSTDPGFLAYFDFDGSGAVDALDLLRFRLNFGTVLGP